MRDPIFANVRRQVVDMAATEQVDYPERNAPDDRKTNSTEILRQKCQDLGRKRLRIVELCAWDALVTMIIARTGSWAFQMGNDGGRSIHLPIHRELLNRPDELPDIQPVRTQNGTLQQNILTKRASS
jgi:hypothetical protein